MKDHFQMMAAYNQWANGLVYEAAAALSEEELNRKQGAFFGSLLGTLNHLLVADRIWLKRMTGTGEAPKSLDLILHPDLAGLAAARRAEDQRIIDSMDRFSEDDLAADFTYTPLIAPQPVTQRLGSALAHVFNHQTHHRGQCHMMLTSLGKPSLTLDLVYFQRVAGRQWL